MRLLLAPALLAAGAATGLATVALHEINAARGILTAFLHEVKAGPASRSSGIDVAKLAGLPAEVIRDARRELERLEKERAHHTPQADLFSLANAVTDIEPPEAPDSALLKTLAALDADDLSPREAHAKLAELIEAARRS